MAIPTLKVGKYYRIVWNDPFPSDDWFYVHDINVSPCVYHDWNGYTVYWRGSESERSFLSHRGLINCTTGGVIECDQYGEPLENGNKEMEEFIARSRYARTFNNIKEEDEMSDLYQIKGEETYGVKLATNSQGKVVLEVKGSGELRTVEPDQIEEVIPYSFSAKFISNLQNGVRPTYHYWGDKGQVNKGDILIAADGTICLVIDTDTKSKKANKRFVGRKVLTEELK